MKIYVIESNHQRTKVGISADPLARLKSLESSGGFTATNFFFVEVGEAASEIEMNVHRELGYSRLETSFGRKSEWFDVPFHVALLATLSKVYDMGIFLTDEVEIRLTDMRLLDTDREEFVSAYAPINFEEFIDDTVDSIYFDSPVYERFVAAVNSKAYEETAQEVPEAASYLPINISAPQHATVSFAY